MEASGEATTPLSSLDGSRGAKQTKRKTLNPRSVLDPTVGALGHEQNERCDRDLNSLPPVTLEGEASQSAEQTSPPRYHDDGKEPSYPDDFVEVRLKVSLFDCKLPGAWELCLVQNHSFGDDINTPSVLVQRALEGSLREDHQEPNGRNRVRRLRDSIRRRLAIREEAGSESQNWPSVDTDYSMDALFQSYASARQCISVSRLVFRLSLKIEGVDVFALYPS